MKLVMNFHNMDADQRLAGFIQKKADKLETFYDRIVSGEAYIRAENDSENHGGKTVEIKLFIPGTSIFAKEQANSFEEAADLVIEGLRKQLVKHKEKLSVR